MQDTINAILAPFKAKGMDAGAEFNGKYWEIWIGSHAGGREDGVSLANELANLVRKEQRPKAACFPPQQAVEMTVPPQPLTIPQADELAKLRARVAELEAATRKVADDIEVPEFLKTPEPIPSELADLIEYADTPAQSNEKLLARLREVLGLIGLAEDAGGRAAPELYRRRDRLESGIRFNRGRMAESL